ncbi:P-selectin [Centropristis striata]|uniref:P-selectin n=1 Tax=Centropristis striata TaxID=184440 RepID=UPI0027E0B480|nr:P-selectin [Centropristis striata]
MMFQGSVSRRQSLHHLVLVAAFILFVQDLSRGGGAQAWTYSYDITSNRRFDDARKWCQQHFTDIVPIRNQEENDYINNLVPYYQTYYYWIGVTNKSGEWIWQETEDKVPIEAQNWAQGEPSNITGQNCVEIYIKRDKDTAKWNNENCRKRKGTICYANSCTQDSCSVNGDCVETVGNYTCQCHPGFLGPRCEEAIACKPLLDPEQGSHSCSYPYGSNRFNSSCRFHCELGFQLVGVPQLLCQASGDWNNPVPLCQVERCPVLEHNIKAGRMNCSHPIATYSYNSTCEVRCDEGYEASGPHEVRCDHTGQWTANVPACTVKKCSAGFFPVTGNVTCVDAVEPFSFGSQCNYTCQEGYYLATDNTFTCLASGQWSNPTPTCTVVQCSSLKDPPHASMPCQNPIGVHSYGSICTVKCEEGFNLIGRNMTKCSLNGSWSHDLPVCQAKRCSPINPPHGKLSCSDPNGAFSFGSQCMTTCDEGFLLNGTASIQCTSVGMWSADTPQCLAKRCPTLNHSSHGSFDCFDPHEVFSFGSRCTSTCKEGFVLTGTADTECTSLGMWSADIPKCQAKRCPTLSFPSHGFFNCSDLHNKFSFGSQCRSTCKEGFVLTGTADTECTSLGIWSADIPQCLAKRCPTLSFPSHGSFRCSDLHKKFSFGSRCTSTCKEGFVLNGTADTECTSLGMWSRELPRCLAQPCPLLAKAQHGRMNCSHPYASFSYGSHCDFECNEGFWLRGAPNMTCNNSGHWSPDLPTCQPVQCEAIRDLAPSLSMNCSHPLGNFSFGSQCLFTCEDGFSLNGTEVLFCSSMGFWNGSLPNCIGNMPVGAGKLLSTGVGATSIVVPLALVGLAVLYFLRRKKKSDNLIMRYEPAWEDRENPAFDNES